MAEVTREEAPQKLRDLFDKGFVAFERGNLDYAVDLLSSCVRAEPKFLHARKFLMAASMQRFKKKCASPLGKIVVRLMSVPDRIRASVMLSSNQPDKALAMVEEMLKRNPLDLPAIMMFAKIMEKRGVPEAAVQMLHFGREHYPENVALLKVLGRLYMNGGRTKDGLAIFEKLGEACPRDPEVLKALKDAMALHSINKDWGKTSDDGASFHDLIKDGKEAELLEQESKAVKNVKDVDNLIADTLKKIETEPGNINYYRALARLYADSKNFDDAVATLQKAMELNPGDPELDNTRSSMRIKQFEHEIKQLNEAGQTEAAQAKEQEKLEYAFGDLQDRVKRYPNDLRLRYQWGCALFENGYSDEALVEFQKAQRNVQHRQMSLYYMALCFKSKKQYDMAVEQLNSAAAELVAMDDVKKGVLYELGQILELTGDSQKAFEYYKQIYQTDASFKDVKAKVEKSYVNSGG